MGDKAVVVGVVDDIGEGMQCMDHPYRGNTGGVCAFCLQEKLGKLVSSSKSSPFFSLQPLPFSSSSSPTSFSSDAGVVVGDALGIGSGHSRTGPAGAGRRTKFSFLAANHREKKKKKKKKKNGCAGGGYGNGGRKVMASIATTTNVAADTASACDDTGVVLKRSKSVEPRMAGGLMQGGCGSGTADAVVADSPRKKSFWSFLYLSSASSTYTSSSAANNSGNSGNVYRRRSTSSSVEGGGRDITNRQQQRQTSSATAATRQGGNSGEEAESPSGSQASSSLGRKVARSRSVGCGSRSFSGDFLERISTGFGDCTLRRAESHREAKSKIVLHLDQHHNNGEQQQRSGTKERVKCGGIFGGLALTSAAADVDFNGNRRISETTAVHGNRTRSWVWAFASPMRAFRPYSSSSKPLHGINKAASASAAPATNIISAINASNDMFNKGNTRLPGNPSSLAIEI
ncbi:hypothetical protein OPV22_011713 [Ensete ventricosum]|uniref:Uncharacterized protein n=1 Tax=Ensete ventricosum TaxID=4639 RepID=A0AAV8RNL8_ENSVE|nr:hypothetical protein OPV22_011713 [Ensete ventricosum]